MIETMGSLRRKIDSAEDLQSVVQTMKALAASSIGQYEHAVTALADYTRTVELGLSACFREAALATPALENTSPGTGAGNGAATGPVSAVVFGSDQGLVGQFNDLVADEACRVLGASPALTGNVSTSLHPHESRAKSHHGNCRDWFECGSRACCVVPALWE